MYAFGKYHLFFKTEAEGNGIKKALSEKLTRGYVMEDRYLQQTTEAVDGIGTFTLNNANGWILMYAPIPRARLLHGLQGPQKW